MAADPDFSVTTSGTGASDYMTLPRGEYVLLFVWAGSAGDADLQVGNGTNFNDAYDVNGVVNITSDYAVKVPGGMCYQVDVTTHTSALTITAHRVDEH